MKYRTLFAFTLLLISLRLWGYSKTIYCYAEQCDFIYDDMKVWQIPNIVISGGDAINDGFSIRVDFSTSSSYTNKTIVAIGTSMANVFEKALEISQYNRNLQLRRQVKLGDLIKEHTVDSWNPELLENLTNYSLLIEIDETRCRYSIWETGNESKKKYEYEFYGLYGTYVKDILSKNNGVFSVATSTSYRVQKLVVSTLAHGYGVKLPEIKTQISWGRIKNVNSSKYISLFNSSTISNNLLVQNSPSSGSSDIWELIPRYQSKRTPLSYEALFRNISSNQYMSISGCSIYNGTPVINSTSSDCEIWNINKEMLRSGYFKLTNKYSSTNAVVENASLEEGTQLISWESADTPNGWWTFLYLEDGGYAIRNVNSQLCIAISDASLEEYAQAIQHSRVEGNEYGNSIWVLEPDNSGQQNIYWLKNIHSGKYLYFSSSEYKNGIPAVQETSSPEHNLRLRWFLEPIVTE